MGGGGGGHLPGRKVNYFKISGSNSFVHMWHAGEDYCRYKNSKK